MQAGTKNFASQINVINQMPIKDLNQPRQSFNERLFLTISEEVQANKKAAASAKKHRSIPQLAGGTPILSPHHIDSSHSLVSISP